MTKNFNQNSKKNIINDLLYKSLIGEEIEIIDSKIKSQIGVKGKIIFESQNMLKIDSKGILKQYLKSNLKIKILSKQKPLYMDGRLLFSTSINRIKKIK